MSIPRWWLRTQAVTPDQGISQDNAGYIGSMLSDVGQASWGDGWRKKGRGAKYVLYISIVCRLGFWAKLESVCIVV